MMKKNTTGTPKLGKPIEMLAVTSYHPISTVRIIAHPVLWNMDTIQLMVHRDIDYLYKKRPPWRISEYKTGWRISTYSTTRQGAIMDAIEKTEKLSKRAVKRYIKNFPKINHKRRTWLPPKGDNDARNELPRRS